MDEAIERQTYLKDKIAYFENNKRSKEYVAHQAKVRSWWAFPTWALNKTICIGLVVIEDLLKERVCFFIAFGGGGGGGGGGRGGRVIT